MHCSFEVSPESLNLSFELSHMAVFMNPVSIHRITWATLGSLFMLIFFCCMVHFSCCDLYDVLCVESWKRRLNILGRANYPRRKEEDVSGCDAIVCFVLRLFEALNILWPICHFVDFLWFYIDISLYDILTWFTVSFRFLLHLR